jgi:hypothetical protein
LLRNRQKSVRPVSDEGRILI